MRILLLTHTFNSLAQRFFVELAALKHQVSVEFDINDRVTEEAVASFQPHLILAPYLRRAIPASIWHRYLCLIVHPGIVGDRGPSALDWAIQHGESHWAVTILQAEAELDAGPVWANASFAMRAATKSSLYRNEVTEAAVRCLHHVLDRLPDYQSGRWQPERIALRPMHTRMQQADRGIDWSADNTAQVLAKINAADGFPGVRDTLQGHSCLLYHAQAYPANGAAGAILGKSNDGVVRATMDGAVWLGHAKRLHSVIKQPLLAALPELQTLPELKPAVNAIDYHESAQVGFLAFNFYNGAMSTEACERLLDAYRAALQRPTKLIVLLGGQDFFSNGLDLNRIEAADSPPDESWRNINAMDDVSEAIIRTQDRLTISALRGNAGAGGAFLALAADLVWARKGVVLNPHYKNMGNLYGSEFWTYLLPRRVGSQRAGELIHRRLPLGTAEAVEMGFLDASFGDDLDDFERLVVQQAETLASSSAYAGLLLTKRERREQDETHKPLAIYRTEELKQMQRNFFGFDPSYHVARHHFVAQTPHSWTPRHLAIHRDIGWTVPAA